MNRSRAINTQPDRMGENDRANMREKVRSGGTNMNGKPLSGTLGEQIRALCFVKNELELYLDTHPSCRVALDYYHQTLRELNRLTEEYNNTVGPLTASGVITSDGWTWATTPWPWQQAGDFMREGK